jgi:hypothetical protein
MGGPFQPSNAMRGTLRNGTPVHFWRLHEHVDDFAFIGYFTTDMVRRPEMWKENGLWAYDNTKHPCDLMLNNTP